MHVLFYDEAARRAGIVRRSLERLIAEGEGPAVIHISQRRRYEGILQFATAAFEKLASTGPTRLPKRISLKKSCAENSLVLEASRAESSVGKSANG